MENKFDELAKGLAQSVTRRQALKRFGVGLAGMALACFGLVNKANANTGCNGCVQSCTGKCVKQQESLGNTKAQAESYCASFCFGWCGCPI